MARSKVMTPVHPDWKDFIQTLAKMECFHTVNNTVLLLEQYYPEIDIVETLALFNECGGYCDCKVVSNVEATFYHS